MPTGVYPRSDAHRERMRKAWTGNKLALGYKFPPELLAARSTHPAYKSEQFRAKVSAKLTGRACSQETKKKLSAAHTGMRGVKAKHPRSEESRHKMRIARMNWVVPVKDSKTELAVQAHLKALGVEFVTHRSIKEIEDPKVRCHQFDIVLPAQKVAIEVDGCYWHACPACRSRQSKPRDSELIQARDAWRVQAAHNAGWTVLRIWEHDVNSGCFDALDPITKGEISCPRSN